MTTTAQVRQYRENPLTGHCDRCGAQAYVKVTMQSGEVLLCRHHGAEHLPALIAQAISIDDYSEAALTTP